MTGASGFVALHIIEILLKGGHRVQGTVRNLKNTKRNYPLNVFADQYPGQVKLFEADLLEPKSFDAAMKGCDGLFHTASPTNFTYDPSEVEEKLVKPAIEGTRNVFNSAVDTGIKRIVLTSSGGVIYHKEKDDPEGSPAPESQVNTYAKAEMGGAQSFFYSKRISELFAAEFAHLHGIKLAAINPSVCLGRVHQNPEGIKSVDDINDTVKYVLQDLIAGITPTAYGLPVNDVEDAAKVHVAAMLAPCAVGRFGVCGHRASDKILADAARAVLPQGWNLKNRETPLSDSGVTFTQTRAENELGMKGKWTPLEDTLKKAVQSLIEAGVLPVPALLSR